MISEYLLILFMYVKIYLFKLTYFNDSIYIYILLLLFFFFNKQKIVQTLLKWLFWTSIHFYNIKKHYFSWSICINNVFLLLHAG